MTIWPGSGATYGEWVGAGGQLADVVELVPKGVFLSYCHRDRVAAVSLKTALERLGVAVRLDVEAMPVGERIQEFIADSIRQTAATVIIVSESSLVSEWVAVEVITTLGDVDLWGKRSFVACYLDEQFLDAGFRLRATDKIDARLSAIEERFPEYAAKKLDTVDLNAEKSRLHDLRANLGKLLIRLKESLVVDIRPERFDASVEQLANALRPIAPGKAHAALAAASDIEQRREEIYDLIANNESERALKRLMDFVRDFSDKRNVRHVIALSGTFRKLEDEKQRSLEETNRERERLTLQALEMVDSIQQVA